MKRYSPAILILAVLLFILAACGINSSQDTETSGVLLYYLDTSGEAKGGDALKAITRDLDLPPDATAAQKAEAAVSALLEDPPEIGLSSPLPGIQLLNVDVQDLCAHVDFSSGFNLLSGIDLTLADYAVTLTLTQLSDISAVSITAQGFPVGQQPKPVFYEKDVRLSINEDTFKTVYVKLYFPNEANELTWETRSLQLYEGQTMAENLIDALLEGPQNREHHRIIPEELSFYSIRVDNSICTLNLMAESLSSLPEDPAEQELILWSIANSLYSVESIRGIRILADGEALTNFGTIPVEQIALKPQ